MKKILMVLFALAASAAVATAGVGIQWQTGYGAYDHSAPVDGSGNLTGVSGQLLVTYSAIWQLIYAGADGAIQSPSLGTAASGYVTGDDLVWATRNIAVGGGAAGDGTTWDNWMGSPVGDTAFVNEAWAPAAGAALNVYQRVFEGTPAPGSYWYDSRPFAFDATWTTAAAPEGPFNPEVNAANGGFQPSNMFPPVVPEPATMGLLGLGALVMAIRRRRQS